MRTALATLVIAALALLGAGAPHAEARHYVTDQLTITVRTGRGNEFQILRTISSGTPVEVIEASDDGYARVRLEDGTEGWLLERYLSDEPVARTRLAGLERERDALAGDNARLRDEVAELTRERSALEDRVERLAGVRRTLDVENERLRALAALPGELRAENAALAARLEELEREATLLREKNRARRDTARRDWFLAGGGVLLGGFLLGVLVSRVRLRRRSSWDRF